MSCRGYLRPNKALDLTEGAEYNLMPSRKKNKSIMATRGVYLPEGKCSRRLAPVR